MGYRHDFLYSLLELIFPEHCVGCGEARGITPWFPEGSRLDGLRPWDAPHFCANCFISLTENERASTTLEFGRGKVIPVLAAQWTNPLLVEMVGAWKYKGVRGMIWPLLNLLTNAWDLRQPDEQKTIWVPVPLHSRRRRERGFNQAHMLAVQLASVFGGTVRNDLAFRPHFTGQQAKLTSSEERLANIRGAFEGGVSLEKLQITPSCRIMIVDDLVTTGATTAALADFLSSHGIKIDAIVCLGAAKPDSPHC